IKRNAMALYRAQRRGGRGRIGATTREEDFVEHLFIASTHSYLLFFTTSGKVFWLKVHEIPQAGRTARGRSITNVLSLKPEEEARPMGRDTYGVRGMKLDEGDEVVSLDLVEPGATLLAVSENGYGKRTEMEEYRLTRRGGKGIITMKTTDKTGRVMGVRMVTD